MAIQELTVICLLLLFLPYHHAAQKEACDLNTTALQGTIHSPNFPGNYSNNQVCVYIITAPPGYQITLTFTDLDLEPARSCVFDFVEIRDGRDEDSPRIGPPLCNTSVPGPVRTFGNQMRIKFVSDSSNTRRGFRATFVSANLQAPFILLASSVQSDGGRIIRIDVETRSYWPVPMKDTLFQPIAVDYDPVEQTIYWTEVGLRKGIRGSALNGSGTHSVLRTGKASVMDGLAVDPLSRLIFYTDSGRDLIAMLTMSTFAHRTIINTSLDKPRAIVLNTADGVMFWTDRGSAPKIERANYDGSDRRTLVSTGLYAPNVLSLDVPNNRLLWLDAKLDTVEVVDMEGRKRRRLLHVGSSHHIYGMTRLHDVLFVAVLFRRKKEAQTHILRFDANAANITNFIAIGSDIHLNDIHAVNPRQYSDNSVNGCGKNNGGCEAFCVPLPSNRRKCMCPDGQTLARDQRSCVGEAHTIVSTTMPTTTSTTTRPTTTTPTPTTSTTTRPTTTTPTTTTSTTTTSTTTTPTTTTPTTTTSTTTTPTTTTSTTTTSTTTTSTTTTPTTTTPTTTTPTTTTSTTTTPTTTTSTTTTPTTTTPTTTTSTTTTPTTTTSTTTTPTTTTSTTTTSTTTTPTTTTPTTTTSTTTTSTTTTPTTTTSTTTTPTTTTSTTTTPTTTTSTTTTSTTTTPTTTRPTTTTPTTTTSTTTTPTTTTSTTTTPTTTTPTTTTPTTTTSTTTTPTTTTPTTTTSTTPSLTTPAPAVFSVLVTTADSLPFKTNGDGEMALTCDPVMAVDVASYAWSVPCRRQTGNTCVFTPRPAEDDGKTVTCTVTTSDGWVRSGELQIELIYPPQEAPTINGHSDDTVYQQGDSLTMTCYVHGGKPIVSSVHFTCGAHEDTTPDIVGTTEVHSLLSIAPLTTEDDGKTCFCTAKWQDTDWYKLSATAVLRVQAGTKPNEQGLNIPVVIGGSAGAVIVIVVIIILVCIVVRKREPLYKPDRYRYRTLTYHRQQPQPPLFVGQGQVHGQGQPSVIYRTCEGGRSDYDDLEDNERNSHFDTLDNIRNMAVATLGAEANVADDYLTPVPDSQPEELKPVPCTWKKETAGDEDDSYMHPVANPAHNDYSFC
ncbi:uncharacterized protein LOC143284291 [Babylonia areolata]|uniref:uncharacterized protein LOC143284291 n=1 Tax=Babylonia areolata TaxID=304850 RepID=UPI003FD1DD52